MSVPSTNASVPAIGWRKMQSQAESSLRWRDKKWREKEPGDLLQHAVTLRSRCQRLGERNRPGRSGWRLTSQSSPNSVLAHGGASEGRKSFRRDAENGGRDDRAPQKHCIVQ